jgi:hypothetical protein
MLAEMALKWPISPAAIDFGTMMDHFLPKKIL